MPLPNDVLSLEELCVKSINAMLVSNKESILQKGYKWRLIFVENLPGNLRTDLLCYEYVFATTLKAHSVVGKRITYATVRLGRSSPPGFRKPTVVGTPVTRFINGCRRRSSCSTRGFSAYLTYACTI